MTRNGLLSSLERGFFWLDSDGWDGGHALLLLLRLVLLHLLLRLLRLLDLLRLVEHLRRGDVGLLQLLLLHLRSARAPFELSERLDSRFRALFSRRAKLACMGSSC